MPNGKKARDSRTLTQVAALPVRRDEDGRLRVLLVTSRETRRWIVPKGWPMKGKKDPDAAAQEALEEAGVCGTVDREPFGSYLYWKRRSDHFELCKVKAYRLAVERQLSEWREKGQRRLAWFAPEQAADEVDEPGLSVLLRRLA